MFAVPGDAVAEADRRYADRSGLGRLRRPVRFVSAGRLLSRNYPPGADPGINDSLVPQQGPNYALAKRLQRWRATVARASGTTVEELSFHTYPKARHLVVLFLVSIVENVGYRQVMSIWRLHALYQWLSGAQIGWGDMKRKATWQQ